MHILIAPSGPNVTTFRKLVGDVYWSTDLQHIGSWFINGGSPSLIIPNYCGCVWISSFLEPGRITCFIRQFRANWYCPRVIWLPFQRLPLPYINRSRASYYGQELIWNLEYWSRWLFPFSEQLRPMCIDHRTLSKSLDTQNVPQTKISTEGPTTETVNGWCTGHVRHGSRVSLLMLTGGTEFCLERVCLNYLGDPLSDMGEKSKIW